jgi:hypothetical protein
VGVGPVEGPVACYDGFLRYHRLLQRSLLRRSLEVRSDGNGRLVSAGRVREDKNGLSEVDDLLLGKQDGGGYKGSHSKTAALVTTSHNLLIPINF